MFVVTEEWIEQFKSERGGWNKRQYEALGYRWPMKNGWKRNIIGEEISDEQKATFENSRGFLKKMTKAEKKEARRQRKQAKKNRKAQQYFPKRTAWKEQAEKFYASEDWRRLRYKALKICGFKCQCCGASAIDGIVLNVDHIKSRWNYPELQLEITNLQVLCNLCNFGKGAHDETDFRTEEQRQQAEHMKAL